MISCYNFELRKWTGKLGGEPAHVAEQIDGRGGNREPHPGAGEGRLEL